MSDEQTNPSLRKPTGGMVIESVPNTTNEKPTILVRKDGRQLGPYTAQSFRQAFAHGLIHLNDAARRTEQSEWITDKLPS